MNTNSESSKVVYDIDRLVNDLIFWQTMFNESQNELQQKANVNNFRVLILDTEATKNKYVKE